MVSDPPPSSPSSPTDDAGPVAPRSDQPSSPPDRAASPFSRTSSPSDRFSSASDRSSLASDRASSPSHRASSASDRASSPSHRASSPSHRASSPSDRASSASDRAGGLLAVTGATGQLGGLALTALRERVPADRLVAVVREPRRATGLGVAVRLGDYDRPDTLRTAFAGVSRLLFVSSPELDPARRTEQHRAVVAAAVAAGVQGLVYTSFLDIPPLSGAHLATEDAIAASGIPFTVLRNPFYSEAFLPGPVPSAASAPGASTPGDSTPGASAPASLVYATAGRPLNTAARSDLAEAAALALLGTQTGRTWTLTGPHWTHPDLAAELGIDAREGEVPGPMGMLHGLARAGLLTTQTPDLAELLGRPPLTMAEVSRSR
nr:NAD(P)H-binding protein [Actinoplanes lichenis]